LSLQCPHNHHIAFSGLSTDSPPLAGPLCRPRTMRRNGLQYSKRALETTAFTSMILHGHCLAGDKTTPAVPDHSAVCTQTEEPKFQDPQRRGQRQRSNPRGTAQGAIHDPSSTIPPDPVSEHSGSKLVRGRRDSPHIFTKPIFDQRGATESMNRSLLDEYML
jgi:hypothetical protein